MKKLFSYTLALLTATCLVITKIEAQVQIDDSAIAVFWEVADTLSTDTDPSPELWSKFASHPAYVQIQKSGNRVTYLKKILLLVFKPSNAEKLQQILEGKESLVQYFARHLNSAKEKRDALDTFLNSNNTNFDKEAFKKSYVKSLEYLPEDIKVEDIDLTIYIALFEDNGFGGKVITIDLLHLMNGTQKDNVDFFGYEFHHALRGKTEKYELFEAEDTSDYPIIEALNKLPLEGVASMVDKAKYFEQDYLSTLSELSKEKQESVTEFRNLVKNANANLAKIDTILSGNLSNKEKGVQIFKTLPWSGHSVGFYMARSIEKEFGKEELISVQYSCIDFFLAYQKASLKDEELYTFSDKTIDFLRSIKLSAEGSQNVEIKASISNDLILTARLKYTNESGKDSLKIHTLSAGVNNEKQSILQISSIEVDGKSVEAGQAFIPLSGSPKEIVIDYALDLKMMNGWVKQVGYSLFPAFSDHTCWYPDIYIGSERMFNKNFRVEIKHPTSVAILTSGELTAQKIKKKLATSTYEASDIKFFSLNVAEGYISKTIASSTASFTYFCSPEVEDKYAYVAKSAIEAANWYKELYGFFPIKHMGIAMGHTKWAGGFPSENIFYIHRGNLAEPFLDWISAHELGHFYWGNTVKSATEDILSDLMLAMGIWIDQAYLTEKNELTLERQWTAPNSQSNMIQRYLITQLSNQEQQMGKTSKKQKGLDFDYNSYIAHGKAATGIFMIAQQVGEENFKKIHQKVVQEYKQKPFGWEDLVRLCQENGWQEADQFVTQWHKGNAIIEYEVRSLENEASEKGNKYQFEVRKRGTVDYPVEIELTDEVGNSYSVKTTGKEKKEIIKGFSKAKIATYRLDPQGKVPMWNSSHPEIQRLFIIALIKAGHTRPAKILAQEYVEKYPKEEKLKDWLEKVSSHNQ